MEQLLDPLVIELLSAQLRQSRHGLPVRVEQQAADEQHCQTGEAADHASLHHEQGATEEVEDTATHGQVQEVHFALDGPQVLLGQGLVLVPALQGG